MVTTTNRSRISNARKAPAATTVPARETAFPENTPVRPVEPLSGAAPETPIRWASLILLAALAAYCNSFQGPFIFDDAAITENSAIRSFRSLDQILLPAVNRNAVDRRPIVNLSLAVNYALGGTAVWGYHAFNLAVHVLGAWTLFAIIRRTLLSPRLRESLGRVASSLALATTVIWTVHPLLTNAVTYVIQRTEVLAGLFYLLTLYCVIRGHVAARPWTWSVAAVAACLLAVGSKESAVSAPLVVLLYDRIFLAGSWREIWRRRCGLYVGLAATWSLTVFLLLRHLTLVAQVAGGDAVPQGEWLDYALLQFRSITWYLQLAFWPRPLILDYGPDHVTSLLALVPYAAGVLPLAAGTAVALRYRPAWGFLGVWFFAILAPSSGMFPLTSECAAEKRMYLPLAAVILAALAGAYGLGQRWLKTRGSVAVGRLVLGRRLAGGLVTGVVVTLIWASLRRNADYRSELSIWQDTVHKRPANARAQNNLGFALENLGQFPEAAACLQRAVAIKPGYAAAHNNLGFALEHLGRFPEALEHLQRAVELKPKYAEAHFNLGFVLEQLGRFPEAADALQRSLELRPNSAEAHFHLSSVLNRLGRRTEALQCLRRAVELRPDYAEAHFNLGNALAARGEADQAMAHYRTALHVRPEYAEAHYNLGNSLAARGEAEQAMAQYQEALQLKPDYVDARFNLSNCLADRGRLDEAIMHLQAALRTAPDDAAIYVSLGNIFQEQGELDHAMQQFQRALEIRPDQPEARHRLALLIRQRGQMEPAIR